uniref:Uncharacterized protein n=1 Tax=Anguilla anguilla TaxID=7936 RepID=A0A0E9SEF2_ANGAN
MYSCCFVGQAKAFPGCSLTAH